MNIVSFGYNPTVYDPKKKIKDADLRDCTAAVNVANKYVGAMQGKRPSAITMYTTEEFMQMHPASFDRNNKKITKAGLAELNTPEAIKNDLDENSTMSEITQAVISKYITPPSNMVTYLFDPKKEVSQANARDFASAINMGYKLASVKLQQRVVPSVKITEKSLLDNNPLAFNKFTRQLTKVGEEGFNNIHGRMLDVTTKTTLADYSHAIENFVAENSYKNGDRVISSTRFDYFQ